ncbi:hypothetical protein FQZ97_838610 [compost metagenome]
MSPPPSGSAQYVPGFTPTRVNIAISWCTRIRLPRRDRVRPKKALPKVRKSNTSPLKTWRLMNGVFFNSLAIMLRLSATALPWCALDRSVLASPGQLIGGS